MKKLIGERGQAALSGQRTRSATHLYLSLIRRLRIYDQVARDTLDTFAMNAATTSTGVRFATRLRNHMDRFRLRVANAEGAALVEFALMVPLLFILVFGMCSFGIAFNQYLQLTEAVNVGAEQLAISRGNTLDPCNLTFNVVKKVSPYLNSSNMTFSFVLNTTSYGPYTSGTVSCSSTSNSTGSAGNLIQGDPVTVTVSYPCSIISLKFGPLYNFNPVPSCNLQAQITEIVQ